MNHPIRLLIIEDDVRIAEIHRRFVAKVPGYEVVGIATDYSQAREQLEVLQPDLVLLDVYFPDMNGLELMREIQADQRDTDVIMITASNELESVREAFRGGAFDFIIKPLVFERFQATLRKYADYHHKMKGFAEGKAVAVDQTEVDRLWRGGDTKGGVQGDGALAPGFGLLLPKGIDRLTLDKVYSVIGYSGEGLTAESVSKHIGVSRSTARRYLEFLVSQGKLVADLSYGTVGRPERIYRTDR